MKLQIGLTSRRFFVDDTPIRVFKNCKDLVVRFPFDQSMKIHNSLWNTDDWATRGGLEKTDWSKKTFNDARSLFAHKMPFVASYKGFHISGCEASVEAKFCATQGNRWWDQKEFQDLIRCSTGCSVGFAANTP
ncbi:Xyloglucan endotransglucosylase protein 34-like protein [Drosera capensis]